MTSTRASLRVRASELRFSFDQAFAEGESAGPAELVDLLAIRIGGLPYVVRLSETAGLVADKKVTPLPSRLAGLSGVATIRGTILPVYDLAALLGATSCARPRWMLLVAARPVGLAFEAFEGLLRVPRAEVERAGDGALSPRLGRTVLLAAGERRPIVDLTAVLRTVVEWTGHTGPGKET